MWRVAWKSVGWKGLRWRVARADRDAQRGGVCLR